MDDVDSSAVSVVLERVVLGGGVVELLLQQVIVEVCFVFVGVTT